MPLTTSSLFTAVQHFYQLTRVKIEIAKIAEQRRAQVLCAVAAAAAAQPTLNLRPQAKRKGYPSNFFAFRRARPSLGVHRIEICGDVRSGGAWAGTLQRLQHPVSVVEGPGAEKREGEAGMSQALLRGRLARHRKRQGRRGRHLYLKPLPEGPGNAAESQL